MHFVKYWSEKEEENGLPKSFDLPQTASGEVLPMLAAPHRFREKNNHMFKECLFLLISNDFSPVGLSIVCLLFYFNARVFLIEKRIFHRFQCNVSSGTYNFCDNWRGIYFGKHILFYDRRKNNPKEIRADW